jgi:poly(3-hydroxybutyrate) depolymerase
LLAGLGEVRAERMLYEFYQAAADIGDVFRTLATQSQRLFEAWPATVSPARQAAAVCEAIALAGFTHDRPPYEIEEVEVRGEKIPVLSDVVFSTPFCELLRFRKATSVDDPKVLLVAPMSGHFATLLRGTARTMLRDHEVFLTDWINPRDIAADAGNFGFDDYTQHLIDFIKHIGPDTHIVAVCQPAVSALAATTIMAQHKNNHQPKSLTLMAGPIDTRVAPTKVNELAMKRPLKWFEDNMISVVPSRLKGGGRRVYPGFIQLSAFMSMNAERHAKSFFDMIRHRIEGDHDKAHAILEFYKEYFAVMDLSADFYLETIAQVFQESALPLGKMRFKGERIDPRAVRKTFLLTVEGEKDDICAVGQTLAAQDMCSGLRPYMKTHHMQVGVGHYGVFNGKRWETQIYPVVRNHIQASR